MNGEHHWRGVALTLTVAASFALNSVLSALAYTGGSNAVSVITVRNIVALAILYVVLRMKGVAIALPSRQRNAALACGLLMALYSYGLLGAFEYMPVALAVITFYTYPILVAATGWISGREAFHPQHAIALVAAFAGLVLALDIWGTRPHALGVALATMAACGLTVLLMVSAKVRGDSDSRPITLHMLATTTVTYLVVSAVLGNFALPHTVPGWVGFVGTLITYTYSVVFMFVALSMLGPVRTSLTMNIEPVITVVLGYLILAQELNLLQMFGIAIVLAAVISVEALKSHVPATSTSNKA